MAIIWCTIVRSLFYFHGLQVGVTIALSIKLVRATTFFKPLNVTPHNLHSKPDPFVPPGKDEKKERKKGGGVEGGNEAGKKTATASWASRRNGGLASTFWNTFCHVVTNECAVPAPPPFLTHHGILIVFARNILPWYVIHMFFSGSFGLPICHAFFFIYIYIDIQEWGGRK